MTLFAQLSLPKDSGTATLLLGAVVFLLVYVVIRPMMRQKKKDPLAGGAGMRSLSQQRSIERQMETLLVELSDMARQMTAQLDTRSAKLEVLLHEADKTIARLKTAEQRAAVITPRYQSSESYPPLMIASDVPAESATPPEPAAPKVEPVEPQYTQIYDLADAGQAVSDIARALARPSGEIELILALRRKRA